MPRHPPCALHSLSHKHSTKTTKTHNPTTPTIKKGNEATTKRIKQQPTPLRAQIAVRCSRPLSTCQTPTPPTPPTHDHAQTSRKRGTHEKPAPPPQTHDAGAVTGPISQRPRPDLSGPNSVPNTHPPTAGPRFHTRTTPRRKREELLAVLRDRPRQGDGSSMIPPLNTTKATRTDAGRAGCVLLRKEVIQPHLPVRLPCYDFVPIASPTFDGSLHKGWATGFGCCRLS